MKPFSMRDMPEPDHYTYDDMPPELRQKIIFCMDDTLTFRDELWQYIEQKLMRAYGRPFLVKGLSQEAAVTRFLRECEVKKAVDVAECFLCKTRSSPSPQRPLPPRRISFEDNLRHINEIFREHGVGYEFLKGRGDKVKAVRIDSKYLHEKAIKKTMKLLYDLNFEGPLSEFDDAIEALDNQDFDGAVNSANKAFESTMKAILEEMKHQPYDPTWPASKLIDALVAADVIPSRFLSFSDGIRKVLEAGLPAMRNAPGAAHGSGRDPKEIERSYAQFAVNLCGSYIVFLIERYKERAGLP